MATFGNMTIVDIKDGICDLKCHCGHEFTAVVKMIDNEKPIRGANGVIEGFDDDPVRCPECDCRWRKMTRELPPLPTEWRFFVMYVMIDGKELPAIVGLEVSIRRFAMFALNDFKNAVDSYRIVEIDEEKYNELLDTSDNERKSSGLLGALFGL